ncbi:MAG: MmcB family DNA repair protein [Rhodospirillaceae bacterium]
MNKDFVSARSQNLRYIDPATITAGVTRGVCRWLTDLNYAVLREFKLGNGRRADVTGISRDGTIVMVEVKSTIEDFRADDKWLEYVPYCDLFSFAVADHFPKEILPKSCGIIIADRHGAAVSRPAREYRLRPGSRRALTLRFAHTAGRRLIAVNDPRI